MIKMMVLDMAGTTVDEDNVVYKTLRKAIIDEGYNISLQQVLNLGAGKEKKAAIQDIMQETFNETTPHIIENIYTAFKNDLKKAYHNLSIKQQPGAEELFKQLKEKNILVVLNTGYNKATATLLLEKLQWKMGTTIDAVITADDVQQQRPHPDMILLAMEQFNITSANEVAKVGDSIIDIEEGINAGCGLSIGITTGAHSKEQLATAKPHFIIDNLVKLITLV